MVLEKTFESLLDCKEVKTVNPKRDQPWIFIGRTDAEAETPILWPPDVKSWLIGKDPGAGKDRRQKEKGAAEDEMIEWHHWLDGHEFEQTGRSWRTEEAGMGWQRVENDLVTKQVNNGRSHTLFTVMPPVHVYMWWSSLEGSIQKILDTVPQSCLTDTLSDIRCRCYVDFLNWMLLFGCHDLD